MPRHPTSPADRKRALALLASGRVALPEMAKIMGVSTHVVWNWCRLEGVDWRKARLTWVMREWRRK